MFINRPRPPHWTGGTDGGRCLSGTSSFRGFSSATQGKDKWKPSPKGKTKFAVIYSTAWRNYSDRRAKVGKYSLRAGHSCLPGTRRRWKRQAPGQPQPRLERKLPIKPAESLAQSSCPPPPPQPTPLEHPPSVQPQTLVARCSGKGLNFRLLPFFFFSLGPNICKAAWHPPFSLP